MRKVARSQSGDLIGTGWGTVNNVEQKRVLIAIVNIKQ
jgi:hypothetical protein